MEPASAQHARAGRLPIVEFVTVLLERGYDGFLSLEIFNDRFRSTSASTVAVDGHRALTFLYDQVARRLAPIMTPEIPPRARVRGVEFVEFAANEEGSAEARAALRPLRLCAPTGRHKNKDVTRWRQNGINFVLNAEPDSFARAYDSMHGASVCALGLSVENLASAVRRADGLQMSRFSQPLGPGEIDIPSLHAVGGSLLYFMEAGNESHIWDTEFETVPGPSGDEGAGLLRVDHIAQTMQHEQMLSWLLYYYALFDVAKAPLVEIADPVGLVQSQALYSADGGLRLTLNSSAAIQTLSSRFLQGFHGAGVQHIALATSDILRSAARLAELGLETLPIPRNYYEDLEARFGLDGGFWSSLRPSTSFTTATRTASTSSCFRAHSRSGSSSSSSSAATIAATARRMHRSVSPRSRAIAMIWNAERASPVLVPGVAHQRMMISTTTSRRDATASGELMSLSKIRENV